LRKPKLWRLLAVLLTFALFAAACGDDDDDTTAADDGTEEPAADDGAEEPAADDGAEEEPATEEPAADDGAEEEPATEEPAADDGAEEPPAGGGLADPAVDGAGADLFEAAVNAPTAADESLDPIVITMPNIEGDPIGSFPDIREGAEAAVKFVNEQLGGIAGRPIQFEPCVHGFDPNAATACADEIAGKNPHVNINGIEFFTPALYPTMLAAGVPIIETVPIFVADFDTAGVTSAFGGCAAAFPGSAQMIGDVGGHDKLAVVYSNTPPGLECYADTQERFYQYYADTAENFAFIGLPDNSGDPSDNDAIIQQVADFLADATAPAVYFGIQAADCNEILSGLASAGVEAQIYTSGACVDEAVLTNPAAAGTIFEHQSFIVDRPDLYSEFIAWEIGVREQAIEAYGPTVPLSTFMRVAFAAVIQTWSVLNQMAAAGGDLEDRAAITAAFQGQSNQWILGAPPVDCTGVTTEYESICKRTLTYATWTGSEWDLAPLNGEYIDVTDLHNAVAEASPRG
jgi:branched-chain amino acid transport system substrate-binding protein